MNLLISDTSVLIDLERSGCLEAVFRLPLRFGVPDLLYEREIRPFGGPDLVALGLEVLTLDGSGVQLAQEYFSREIRLSLPDSFALALAKRGGHGILTGDGPLRALAETEGVGCHGVLWVIDQLTSIGTMQPLDLLAGLQKLAIHPRCRLPRKELQLRIHRLTPRKRD